MGETFQQNQDSQENNEQAVRPLDADYILREVVMVKLVAAKEDKDYLLD